MRFFASLISLSAWLLPVAAVFGDEAYHIDYHDALLGLPLPSTTLFHRPQSSSNATLLYTISEKGVLGAVNPKDGSLLWRQSLAETSSEGGSRAHLVACEADGVVIGGLGHTVSSWSALDGKLAWSVTLATGTEFGQSVVQGLRLVQSGSSATNVPTWDVIVLLSDVPNTGTAIEVFRLDGKTGQVRWSWSEDSGDTPLTIATSPSEVYYFSRHTTIIGVGKLRVTALDPATGKQVNHYLLNTEAEPSVADGGTAVLTWSEKPFKVLKIHVLGTTKISSLTIENSGGEEIEDVAVHSPTGGETLPHFLVHIRTSKKHWADIYHLDLKSGDVVKAYSLPAVGETGVFATSTIDANVYFTRITETEVSLYSSASHGMLGRWPRPRKGLQQSLISQGKPSHAVAEVVSRGTAGFAIRVAETSTAGEWTLIRNGEMVWSRPEMLAHVVAAAWVEDMVEGALAQELEAEVLANSFDAYIHRVKRHARDVQHFPQWLQTVPLRMFSSFFASKAPGDKEILGSKTLIVGTDRLQVLALDAGNAGAIIWSHTVPQVDGVTRTFTQIQVDNGLATIHINDGSVGLVLNVTDGAVTDINNQAPLLKSTGEIAGGLGAQTVLVQENGIPKVIGQPISDPPAEGNIIVTIDDDSQAVGWSTGQSASKLWSFSPGLGTKIVNAVSRPNHDPVASIGKVLGDRSVLYKYLSPNLALLTAVSSNTLTMYLIESITGAVLHTSTYSGVDMTSPIPSLMSENWFAYSFFGHNPSTSTKSYQLIISELYESEISNDRGQVSTSLNYSSFDPGAIMTPHVIQQAFTIAEPISHMAVTRTGQGITTRQLLCTLPNSNAIVGIPRHILDPRRPVDRDPTPAEAEEGLFRYTPFLDLDPKWYLTHAREVMGIKKIMSSPTLFESTSLVFAFGHDIFGTRVAPSMAFDVLGKGFNKLTLLGTVALLAIGVGILAPIVRKKQVEWRWKML